MQFQAAGLVGGAGSMTCVNGAHAHVLQLVQL
jgi:hypothetical protein